MANTIAKCAVETGGRRTRGPLLLGTALSSVMLSGVVLVGLSSPAMAQLAWDPGLAGDGTGGGNGTWDANNLANWYDGATDVVWPAGGGSAIFDNGPGAVTVDTTSGAVLVDGFAFNSDGYVISGDPLTLNNGGGQVTVTVTNGLDTATISSVIEGAAAEGLTKAGAGTLVLGGVNTYSGGTIVAAGTLAVSNNDALGTGGVQLQNGASLRLNGVTIANAVSVAGTQSILVNGINSMPGYSGVAGAVTNILGVNNNAATEQLTLTTTSTFAGTTNVGGTAAGSSVTLIGGAVDAFGPSGVMHVETGSVLDIGGFNQTISSLNGGGTVTNSTVTQAFLTNQGASSTFSGVITDSGNSLALAQNSAGNTLTLSGVNTYHGPTRILAGTLALSGSGSIADSADVQIATGGTFDISATTTGATINTLSDTAVGQTGSVVLGSKTLTFGNAGTTFSGDISGLGSLALSGGTQTLAGANTYSGTTTIANGTLSIASDGNLGAGNVVFTTAAGGSTASLQVTGSTTIDNGVTVNTGANGTNQILVNAGQTATLSGQVTGAGALTKAGAGTLALAGSNTAGQNYTGTLGVDAGVLQIGNGTTFGDIDGPNGATLQANAGGRINLGVGTTIAGNVVNNGGTISAGASPGTTNVAGNYTVNSGTELFELGEAGVVGGANNDLINVSGTLSATGGQLQIQNLAGNALPGAGVYRLYTYGTLGGAPAVTIVDNTSTVVPTSTATLYLSPSGAPTNGTVNLRVFGLTQLTQYYDGADTDGTLNGGGQGTSGVWDTGTTNWNDSPTTGVINDLWRGQKGVFGGTAGTVNVSGTQDFQDLQFSTDGYVLSGGTINAVGAFGAANGASTITVDPTFTATIGSVITDNGTISELTKLGAGTLILTGDNLNTQPTHVAAGILQIGTGTTSGRIGQNAGGTVFSDVAIDAGARLDISRNDAANAPYVYGGVLSGSGDFRITSSGTAVLTGNSGTYTGAALVDGGGQLVVNGTLGAAGSTLGIQAGSTLSGNGTFGGAVTVGDGNGGNGSEVLAPGALDGTGASTAGTLTIGNGLTLNSDAVASYQLDAANSGIVGGGSDLVVVSGGDLTINTGATLNLVTPAPVSGAYRLFNVNTGGVNGTAVAGNVVNFAYTGLGASTAFTYIVSDGPGINPDQVNVGISNGGQIVQYWDGADMFGQTGNSGGGTVDGGTGTWNATNTNWTVLPNAGINGPWASQVGVFAGTSGVVTVAGAQNFQGLQFTVDGYVVDGPGTLNMTGDAFGNASASFFNVDTGVTATVNANITGVGIGLDKIVGTGTLVLGGTNTYTGATHVAAGTLTISGTGSITSNVTNDAGATFNNNGTVTGSVTNAGTATNTGTVTAGLTNSNSYTQTAGATNGGTTNTGTVAANGGAFNGAIANNAGQFNVGGTVTSDATSTFNNAAGAQLNINSGSYTMAGVAATNVLTNAGALNVAAGATLTITAGNLLNSGTIINFGTINDDLNNTGTVTNNNIYNANVASNTGTINNNGTWNGNAINSPGGIINNTSVWNGSVTNAGTFNSTTSSSVTGAFANNATINLQDGQTDDILTIGGTYSGTGQINMDIALSGPGVPGGQLGDRIVVGGDFQGNTTFNFTNVSGAQTLQPDILVADLNNAQPNTGTVTATGLPNGGLITYALVQNGAGDWVVRSVGNPVALGGIAGNIAIVQATIGAIVNRPSSPFVSGLATDVEPNHCGPGPWMRAVGGGVRAQGTTTSPAGFAGTSTVDLGYAGAQFGLDLACFNVKESGFDVAAGAIAGTNGGYSRQDLGISGITTASFKQGYAGAYVTVSKGAFSADVQARIDGTGYTFNNSNIGLTNASLSTVRTSLSGSASYAIPLQDFNFVPTAGFSASRTTGTPLTFDTGQTLTPDASLSLVGFVGGTIAKTIILPDQVSAMTPFVTGTIYNDFAPNPTATFFDPQSNISQTIVSQHLGTIGEVSLGVNYVKILEGDSGPKQINATVRADARFSDRVLGAGITGQVRAQF